MPYEVSQRPFGPAVDCGHGLPRARRPWAWLVTRYQPPKARWKHLRTTNPIESPFTAAGLRTAVAKRYKKVENATAVIWKRLFPCRDLLQLLGPIAAAERAEGGRPSFARLSNNTSKGEIRPWH